MRKVHSATLYFSEEEVGNLAGFFLGRVKDLETETPHDTADIARCESMAGMFISYLPIGMQNDFREVVDQMLDNPNVNNSVKAVLETVVLETIKKRAKNCSICSRVLPEEIRYCEITDCPHK